MTRVAESEPKSHCEVRRTISNDAIAAAITSHSRVSRRSRHCRHRPGDGQFDLLYSLVLQTVADCVCVSSIAVDDGVRLGVSIVHERQRADDRAFNRPRNINYTSLASSSRCYPRFAVGCRQT